MKNHLKESKKEISGKIAYGSFQKELNKTVLQKETAPKLRCDHCGFVWAPEPYKWRVSGGRLVNMGTDNPARIIICPSCNKRLRVPLGMVFLILAWWKVYYDQNSEEKSRVKLELGI